MVWPSPGKSNKSMESSRVFKVVTAISSTQFHKPILHAVAVYCMLLLYAVAAKVERSRLSRENGGISGSNSSTIESDLKALFFMKF